VVEDEAGIVLNDGFDEVWLPRQSGNVVDDGSAMFQRFFGDFYFVGID
jgi:hypothetical protein